MATPKIFESEYRFCLILWEREPVSSAELAKICKEKLGWSRTTTYTVIHRLSERGVVKNEGGLVSSLVSKDEAQAAELDALVEKTFEGSFLTRLRRPLLFRLAGKEGGEKRGAGLRFGA